MANVPIHFTAFTYRYIATDKGIFSYLVGYTQENFQVGDYLLTFLGYETGDYKMAPGQTSVLLSNTSGSQARYDACPRTEFTSAGGGITFKNESNGITFRIKGEDGVTIYSSSISGNWNMGNGQFMLGPIVTVAPNGTKTIMQGLRETYWTQPVPTDRPVIYIPNTANKFGIFMDRARGNAGGYTVNESTIAGAEALFRDSTNIADPYAPIGYIDPEGDTGFPERDDLPQDELAVGGSNYNDLTAGLYRAYAMTASQLNDFSDQLWNTDILDALSRYFQSPADLVLGLYSYPFDIDSGSATQIGFNWMDAWGLTSIVVYGHPITDGRPQHLSFGHITIPHYSGTFYDFAPYSSVELYLPYIGFVPLKMNEVVGCTIYIDYYVDIFSGDFTATLSVDGSELNPDGLPIFAQYQGNIAKPLPLTQQNMWQVYKKIGETATAALVASGAAMVGAGAGIEADRYAAIAKDSTEKIGSLLGAEDVADWATAQSESFAKMSETGYKTAVRSGLAGAANAILNMQSINAPIVRNGTLDGSVGRTSSQECFAIISVPDQSVPSNQNILGFPSNIPGPLSKVSGYTEVREIRLASAYANNDELAEIEEIVRGGIII